MSNLNICIATPGENQSLDDLCSESSISAPDTGLITNNNLPAQPVIGASIILFAFAAILLIVKHQKTHKVFSVNKNFKVNRRFKTIGSSLALLIAITGIAIQLNTQNKPNESVNATDANTLAISVEDINLNIARKSDENTYGVVKNAVTVKTATTNGYTLKAYSSQTTDLISQTDDTKKIVNISGQNTTLTDNTWGIATVKPTDETSTVWNNVPLSESEALTLKSTYFATKADDTTEVYYGSYVTPDLPDDIYSGVTINYVAVANVVPTPPTSNNKIHFITHGAYLIESNGRYGLIDSLYALSPSDPNDVTTCYGPINCSEYESETVKYLVDYLDSLGVKKLDFIVGSHSHSDHLGGMPLIARKYVDSNTTYYYRTYVDTRNEIVFTGDEDFHNRLYFERAVNSMTEAGATLEEITNKYPSFQFGDFKIDIMNTEPPTDDEMIGGLAKSENNNSIVVLVSYGSKKTLITTDMHLEDEAKTALKVGEIDILQAGHHGNESSTGLNFISTIKPKDIIIPDTINEYLMFSSFYYAHANYSSSIYTTKQAPGKIIIASFDNDDYILSSLGGEIAKAKINVSDAETDGICKKVNFYYDEGAGALIKTLYMDNNVPLTGWQDINCFNETGKVHLDNNGIPTYGWQELNRNGITSWYYFGREDKGLMATGWKKIGWQSGQYYWFYFDDEGRMQTGWQELEWEGETHWYYFNQSGFMQTGWQYLNRDGTDSWFYFNDGGKLQYGFQHIYYMDDISWFYFDDEGRMLYNWQVINWQGKDHYFYFGGNGRMRTGWQEIDSKWYYFAQDGTMQTGWQYLERDGQKSWFYFNDGGQLEYGFQKLDYENIVSWFYFDEEGRMVYRWRQIEWEGATHWYYFGENGRMVAGVTMTIDGQEYTFDASGACVAGYMCN